MYGLRDFIDSTDEDADPDFVPAPVFMEGLSDEEQREILEKCTPEAREKYAALKAEYEKG
jgi:hypothetical protein